MKKHIIATILLLAIALATLSALAGCSSKEYALDLDENMQPVISDDNYRTFYEIFVGGFSDDNGDGMGDLRGVIKRLDYLNDGDPLSGKSLGIDGIWLMPIMPSVSYHKYDVTDYKSVASVYGTMDDMRKLVSEAHKRGINIIIDLVLNHTSSYHPWFDAARTALKNGDVDDPYYDFYSVSSEKTIGHTWYEFAKDPNGTQWYYEGNFSSEMPELNYDNPAVKQAVEDIIAFWLSDVGIDGFRLDAVKYFYYGDDARNIEVLKWIDETCRKYKQDAYIVGENWSSPTSVQNYYQAVNCFDFSFAEGGGRICNAITMGEGFWFTDYLQSYYNTVKASRPDAIMAPFLSNHDMDRSAGYLNASDNTLQLAASMYLLMPGNPFIYYGEEIGMKGSRGDANTDANRRLAMLWGDGDLVRNPIGSTYSGSKQTNGTVAKQLGDKNSIYNHYKKAIALRNANPEIARGDVTAVTTLGDGVAALKFDYNGKTVYVLHNLLPMQVTVDLSDLGDLVLSGWLTDEVTLSGGTLTMAPMSSAVLRAQ